MGVEERKHLKGKKVDFLNRFEVVKSHLFENKAFNVSITYSPDRYIIDLTSTKKWLDSYKKWDQGLDFLGVNIIDDINNEIIPKSISIKLWDFNNNSLTISDKQLRYKLHPK